MRKLILLATLVIPLYSNPIGTCSDLSGTACSTGYTATGAKVHIAAVVSGTGINGACPTTSPTLTWQTQLTTYGTTSNPQISLCYSFTAVTGTLTYTQAASTHINASSYDTFLGLLDSGSDLGGKFYSPNTNPLLFSAFTPSATGDLIFGCVYEFTNGADSSIGISTNHDANFSGGAGMTRVLKAVGAADIIDCWFGKYDSTTAVTLTGTINNTFSSAEAMLAISLVNAARRKNGSVN